MEILKLIQGKDKLIYTHDEADQMSELIERVKLFYPHNSSDEADQKKLVKSFEKLQKLIRSYAEVVNLAMLSQNVSQSAIEKLKSLFETIIKLEKQSLNKLDKIEMKYN